MRSSPCLADREGCVVKKAVTVILLVVAVLAVLVPLIRGTAERGSEVSGNSPDETMSQNAQLAPDADMNIVYYFMTSQRCPSCMKIEAFTKEALDNDYASALNKGELDWRIIEVDNRANIHFVKKYELVTKSVVLSKVRDGKEVEWRNLDQVWQLLDDKDQFENYVTTEVSDFFGDTL